MIRKTFPSPYFEVKKHFPDSKDQFILRFSPTYIFLSSKLLHASRQKEKCFSLNYYSKNVITLGQTGTENIDQMITKTD
jgi:hypothetical protein